MSNAQTAKAPAPHVAPKPAAAPAPKSMAQAGGEIGGITGLSEKQVADRADDIITTDPKLSGTQVAVPAPAKFSIHDNVAMPPSLRAGVSVYPWGDLKVGQSLFIPGKTQKAFGGQVAQAGKAQRKKEGLESYKLSSRNMTHEGVAGVMVWRIA